MPKYDKKGYDRAWHAEGQRRPNQGPPDDPPEQVAGITTKTEVHYYAGPPNSGKTHEALQDLGRRGGAFAVPLVRLAHEIHGKLEKVHAGKVSLKTGNDKRYIRSPHIVVGTYECLSDADYAGKLLIIDELEFATTPRGLAIVRLLESLGRNGAPKKLILIGPGEPEIIEALESEIHQQMQVRYFRPFSRPGLLREPVPIDCLEPQDCLCVKSFKHLCEVSKKIYRHRPELTVIYLTGADSAESRKKLQAFDEMQLGHVTLATTAVSHGMNLRMRRMIFDMPIEDFETEDPWHKRVLFQMAHRVARGYERGWVGATTPKGITVLERILEGNFGGFSICLSSGEDELRDALQKRADTRVAVGQGESAHHLTQLLDRALKDEGDGTGLEGELEGYLEETTDASDEDLRLFKQISSFLGAQRAQEMAQRLLADRWPGNKQPGRRCLEF